MVLLFWWRFWRRLGPLVKDFFRKAMNQKLRFQFWAPSAAPAAGESWRYRQCWKIFRRSTQIRNHRGVLKKWAVSRTKISDFRGRNPSKPGSWKKKTSKPYWTLRHPWNSKQPFFTRCLVKQQLVVCTRFHCLDKFAASPVGYESCLDTS